MEMKAPNIGEAARAVRDDLLLKRQKTLFYYFEPYDGVDGKPPEHIPGGARFQKSKIVSTKKYRFSIAANQTGKTVGDAVEIVTMMTGEIPYSMRYPDGMDTGIPRLLPSDDARAGRDNVKRWGRRKIGTQDIIDYNPEAKEDGSWHCGNIIGVGQFPKQKLCWESGQRAWVCCWKETRDNVWIDLLRKLIPDFCLDKTRGIDGYSSKNFEFYLQEGRVIKMITYEQKFEKVEGKQVWVVELDEEPMSRSFFTGTVAHCYWMMGSWTPIHGLIWSYEDIYTPAIEGNSPDVEVFHATAYDCPYKSREEIDSQARLLKAYEIDAKILGIYSKREGRPYFPYDLCKRYIDDYRPRHIALAKIAPVLPCDTVRKTAGTPMHMISAESRGPDVWEIYEDVRPECAYWSSQDLARGHDDPDKAQDASVCYVFRRPIEKAGELSPVMVAALHSTETVENFARLCLYGAVYYNRALMAPEARGEDAGAFIADLRDYPWLYHMTVENWRTRRPTEVLGFDTNARTRTTAINKVRKWCNEHEEQSDIPHFKLLQEMLEMQWRKGRPDHPENGSSDCVMAFAIGLWVWDEDRAQIRCNAIKPTEQRSTGVPKIIRDRIPSTRRVLGQRGLSRPSQLGYQATSHA